MFFGPTWSGKGPWEKGIVFINESVVHVHKYVLICRGFCNSCHFTDVRVKDEKIYRVTVFLLASL